MKQRLNLTVDADLIRLARQLAHERDTSVSALVQECLRNLPSRAPASGAPFVAKWAGRLHLAPLGGVAPGGMAPLDGEPRREYLWRKFGLDESESPIESTGERQEPGCGSCKRH